MRPFTVNDPWPLVPALVTTAGLAVVATLLAARRDVGDGLLASADVSPVRGFGLGSATGLSARLERWVLAGWCVGAAAAALLMGVIAKLTTANVPSSLRDTLDKFGVRGSFADQYLGVAFLLVATVVALLPASQVAAANEEEVSGRLVHVVAGVERRTGWFVGRLALTVAAIVVAAGSAGVAAWVGARSQGVDVAFGSMLGAGLNVVPTALLVLGIGAVVLAVAPRAAAAAVYGVVIWSLVVDLAGSLVTSMPWLSKLSLFHYMALAPARYPDAGRPGLDRGHRASVWARWPPGCSIAATYRGASAGPGLPWPGAHPHRLHARRRVGPRPGRRVAPDPGRVGGARRTAVAGRAAPGAATRSGRPDRGGSVGAAREAVLRVLRLRPADRAGGGAPGGVGALRGEHPAG